MITYQSRIPDALRNRLLACQTEDNWDDEGATGISVEACQAAIRFLEEVLSCDASIPLPRVSSSIYGEVSLYWFNQGNHLIVRPSIDPDRIYYRNETIDCPSVSGLVTQKQAIERILNLYSADHVQ